MFFNSVTFVSKRLGHAVIVNNLDLEQTPTRQDVLYISRVLRTIGESWYYQDTTLAVDIDVAYGSH